ncbi:MAG: DUF6279 family lipoprotein [Pseudomonadota bacterium]
MKNFNTQGGPGVRLRACALILATLLLAACSTIRFTYNHGETILYWWVNAYVGLDSDQSGWVRKDIDSLFQWHRKTELKEYAQVLENGQRQLDGNMTEADLLADFKDVKARSEALLLKAVPDLADLARAIKPEQIARIEKKFASNNDDYRKKFLRGTVEKRQKLRYQNSMEQFEMVFGSFSREQEARIRKASDARALDNEIWLDERMRRQQKILAVLRKVQQEKLGKEAAMAVIRATLQEMFERFDAPERKAFFDAYLASSAQFIVGVIKLATPAQKAHAHQRLQGWIDDFHSLAADGKPL